jgi:hypothetical protein
MKTIRRYRLVKGAILSMLFAMAAIIAAGIPSSILPGASLEFLLKDFLPDLLMVLTVGAVVRSMRDLEWLLGVHVAGAMIYNLYAFIFFGVDGSGRLGGMLYYDANDFSQTIICTLPVTFYFLREGSPPWQRRLALGAIPILLINFIRAGSRGGFLGFAAIAVCALLGFSHIRARKRFLAVVLILAGITAVGGDAFWAKMKTILSPKDDYNMQSDTGRWQLWKNALSIVRQRPFVGVGARQYAEANATLSDLARARIERGEGMIPWQRAHNAYVSVAAETGVIGFAVFVSLLLTGLVTPIRIALRARHATAGEDIAALARALAISQVGYMVSAFFLTAEYQAVLYLNFGLLLAVRKIARETLDPVPATRPALRGRPALHDASLVVPAAGATTAGSWQPVRHFAPADETHLRPIGALGGP